MPQKPNLAIDADENLERLVDHRELARLHAPGAGPNEQCRFIEHLMVRAPNSILARVMLARVSDDDNERLRLLDEGMRMGLLRWGPELLGLAPEPPWPGHPPARYFIACIIDYGKELGRAGLTAEASRCFGLLLRLDPGDKLGALAKARKSGWLRDGQAAVLESPHDFHASIVTARGMG